MALWTFSHTGIFMLQNVNNCCSRCHQKSPFRFYDFKNFPNFGLLLWPRLPPTQVSTIFNIQHTHFLNVQQKTPNIFVLLHPGLFHHTIIQHVINRLLYMLQQQDWGVQVEIENILDTTHYNSLCVLCGCAVISITVVSIFHTFVTIN